MANEKKREEDAGVDGIAPEAGSELSDVQVEGVSGGGDGGFRCPDCGSTNYFFDPANHIMICEDCVARMMAGAL